jgi:hypothetical protein
VPKGSHKVLSVKEKVDTLNLIRKEKKMFIQVPKICSKNEFVCEIVKKEKEICASFVVGL